jgi:hypothetical protein
MLTNKDKAWLKSRKWKNQSIELLEKELKRNEVRIPYFIRSKDGTPLAEIHKVGGKQCLKIL